MCANSQHHIMLTDRKVLLFGPLLPCLFLLYRIRRIKQVWQAFGNLPAHFVLVSPLNVFSRLLPRIPWISDGLNSSWENVHERQLLPRLSLSYTAHSLYLGFFAAFKSDIIQIQSLFPGNTPQLLVADAAAAKVGLVCKWSPFCSICPFRLSFKAVWRFLRLWETSKPFRKSHMVQASLSRGTMSGESTEESRGQASPRATMSWSGNQRSRLSLSFSTSGTEMGRGVSLRCLTSRR